MNIIQTDGIDALEQDGILGDGGENDNPTQQGASTDNNGSDLDPDNGDVSQSDDALTDEEIEEEIEEIIEEAEADDDGDDGFGDDDGDDNSNDDD